MAKRPTSQRMLGGSRIHCPAPLLGGLGKRVQRAIQHLNGSGPRTQTQTLSVLRLSITIGYGVDKPGINGAQQGVSF